MDVQSDNMISYTKSNKGCIDEGNTGGRGSKSIRVYLPLLLTALVCISAIPLIFGTDEADAAVGDTFIVDGINYRVTAESPNTVEVIWNSYTGNIVIPLSVTNAATLVAYEVTGIGHTSFLNCTGLTSVTIPDSVTSIGESAFYGCSSLISVTIPGSVTSIGVQAFRDSGLTSVTIPGSVTSIGESAFYGCSGLTSITIPGSVTSIRGSTFRYCSGLTSITIPNSVTSIGDWAFNFSGLTSITIPNSVTIIGHSVFDGCSGLTSAIIPDSITNISRNTFARSGLTSITIPNSVTSIGAYAFSGCSSLTSVTIPNSVTSTGNGVFDGCTNMQIVATPEVFNISQTGLAGKKIVRYAPGSGVLDIKFGVNAVIDGSDIVTLTYVSEKSDLVSFSGSGFPISSSNTFQWTGNVNVTVDFTSSSECGVTVTENRGTRIILSNDNTVSGNPQTGLAYVGHDYVFSVSGIAGDVLDVKIEINGIPLTPGTEYTMSRCMYTIIGSNIPTGAEITISATGAFDVTAYNTSTGTLTYSVNSDPEATFPPTGISVPWDDSVTLYLSGGLAETVSVWEWNGNKEISENLIITNERCFVKVSEVPGFYVTSSEAPRTYITGEGSALVGENYEFTVTSDIGVIFAIDVTIGTGPKQSLPIDASNTYTIPMADITGDILIETVITAYNVTFDMASGTYNTGTITAPLNEDYVFTITSDIGVIFAIDVTIGTGPKQSLPIDASNTYTISSTDITDDILIETIVTAYAVSIATVGNGSVSYSLDGITYTEYDPLTGDIIVGNGEDIFLIAIPSPGNRFSGWTGPVPSGDETNDTITLTVDADIAITAEFSIIISSYNVYKYPGEGTEISGNQKAKRNTDYQFTVNRTEGYIGDPVTTVTVGSYSVQYTGTGTYTIEGKYITGSVTIRTTDLFEEDEFVTINIEGKGTVRYSVDNGNTFLTYLNPIHIADGVAIVLKAIPDGDNVLKEWKGVTLSDSRSDTVSVNNTNKTITAVFSSSDDNGNIIDGIDNIVLIAIIVIVAVIVIGCIFVFVIRAR